MSEIDPVQLLSRWLHIVAAVTAAGGAIFMKLALHPAAETLPEAERKQLREAVRSRWAKVVMAAITVLLVTGFTEELDEAAATSAGLKGLLLKPATRAALAAAVRAALDG